FQAHHPVPRDGGASAQGGHGQRGARETAEGRNHPPGEGRRSARPVLRHAPRGPQRPGDPHHPNRLATVGVCAIPLPQEATRLLEASSELVRTLEQVNLSLREGRSLQVSPRTLEAIADLKAQLGALLQGHKWKNAVERIWAFGPRRSSFMAYYYSLSPY
ncbi:hypothetical protein CRUP_007355, partial [Coryphaenoides rupestris]